MEHKGTVPLETPRLILRPHTPEDVEPAFRNWTGDDRVTEFLTWPTARSLEEAAPFILHTSAQYHNPEFYVWAIVPKNLMEPIGTISCVSMDEATGKIHIGYCIGSKWWRRGYMTEAFSRVISFFFEEVKAQRIEALHDVENPNSGAVMKKCGLTYEGTMRQSHRNNRGIVDVSMYAILAEDYFKKHTRTGTTA